MKLKIWTTFFCTLLATLVSIGLFLVKHEVKEQEARLAEINQNIKRNQAQIHVLKAEWAYLNDPARLETLAQTHLKMTPVAPSQMASLDVLDKALSNQYAMVAKPTIRPDKNKAATAATTAVAAKPSAPKLETLSPSTVAAAPKLSTSPNIAPQSGHISTATRSDTERLLDELSRTAQSRANTPQPVYTGQPRQPQPSRGMVIQSPAVAQGSQSSGQILDRAGDAR